MLKALILAGIAQGENRATVTASFRGGRAHDFEWLRQVYFEHGGTPIPKDIAKLFTLVNSWSTDLRYKTGTMRIRDADTFLAAVARVVEWVDGRC